MLISWTEIYFHLKSKCHVADSSNINLNQNWINKEGICLYYWTMLMD